MSSALVVHRMIGNDIYLFDAKFKFRIPEEKTSEEDEETKTPKAPG